MQFLQLVKTKSQEIIERMTAPRQIEESSLSRIWQLLNTTSVNFAVISAYKLGVNPEENERNTVALLRTVLQHRWGFIRFDSGYEYQKKDTPVEPVREESILIRGIDKTGAIALAQQFGQESLLWKDGTGFFMLSQDGTILETFKTGGKDMTFDPVVLKKGFSALQRANKNQRRPFSFVKESTFTVRHLPDLEGFANYLR